MKRIFLTLCAIALGAIAANAQNEQLSQAQIDSLSLNAGAVALDASVEFPYSKVMFATRSELIAQKFEYDSYYNQMELQHLNGLMAVLNIFSSYYTPATEDYRITIQYGEGNAISYVQVTFYDRDIFEGILNFAGEKECDVREIKTGTGTKHTFNYGGYSFGLEFSHVEQKHSNTNTNTNKDGKYSYSTTTTQDVSYDQYVYTVSTGVKATSEYLTKQATKKAKRAARRQKAQSATEFF